MVRSFIKIVSFCFIVLRTTRSNARAEATPGILAFLSPPLGARFDWKILHNGVHHDSRYISVFPPFRRPFLTHRRAEIAEEEVYSVLRRLKSELDKTKAENLTLRQTLDSFNKGENPSRRVEELQERIDLDAAIRASLEEEALALRSAATAWQTKREKMLTANRALVEKLKAAEDGMASSDAADRRLAEARAECDALRARATAYESELAAFRARSSESTNESTNEDDDERIQDLEQKLAALQSERDTSDRAASDERAADLERIAALEVELDSVKSESESYGVDSTALEPKLEEAEARASSLQTELTVREETYEASLNEALEALGAAEDRAVAAEDRAVAAEDRAIAAEERVVAAEGRNDPDSSSKLATAHETISLLETRVSSFEDALAERDAASAQLAKELESTMERLRTTTESERSLEEELAELRDRATMDAARTISKSQTDRDRIADLEGVLKERELTVKTLTESLRAAESRVAEVESMDASTTARVDELLQRITLHDAAVLAEREAAAAEADEMRALLEKEHARRLKTTENELVEQTALVDERSRTIVRLETELDDAKSAAATATAESTRLAEIVDRVKRGENPFGWETPILEEFPAPPVNFHNPVIQELLRAWTDDEESVSFLTAWADRVLSGENVFSSSAPFFQKGVELEAVSREVRDGLETMVVPLLREARSDLKVSTSCLVVPRVVYDVRIRVDPR